MSIKLSLSSFPIQVTGRYEYTAENKKEETTTRGEERDSEETMSSRICRVVTANTHTYSSFSFI